MQSKPPFLFSGFVLVALFWVSAVQAQPPQPVPFYPAPNGSTQTTNTEICAKTAGFMSDAEVEALVTMIVKKFNGTENRFAIVPCDRVANCQALSDNGKPYILYNPNFLGKVKSLSFTTSDITSTTQDWQTLTILAHEIGHHLNFHFTAPHPEATLHQMELEADRTAGFILCRLGATLDQALSVMYSNLVPFYSSMTHPSRDKRVEAVTQGYLSAKDTPRPVKPVIPNPQPVKPNKPVSPSPQPVNPTNPDLPCLQSTAPGYLGLSGMSVAGGAIVLWGISKYNAANNWYRNTYSVNPTAASLQEFNKYKKDYTTNAKVFMGAGAAVAAVGAIVFIQKIAKVSLHNRDCVNGRLSQETKPRFKIEPLLCNSNGASGIGVAWKIQR